MEIALRGGPRSGEFIQVAHPPDAIEFPVYTTNGGCASTCRYERVKKTCQYDFQGIHEARKPIPAPPEKSVVIKKRVVKVQEVTDKPVHGHMEWSEKHGRCIVVKDAPKKEEKK